MKIYNDNIPVGMIYTCNIIYIHHRYNEYSNGICNQILLYKVHINFAYIFDSLQNMHVEHSHTGIHSEIACLNFL